MNLQISLMLIALQGVVSQNEICAFYGLHADCWYRIDGITLSNVKIRIDPCSDPIQVTFTVTNGNPKVDETYVFTADDTMVSLPFYVKTELRVQIRHKPDNVINVEGDFYVYGMAKADFINDDVKLLGIDEQCPGLNTAAKIAVGVMSGLAGVAVILIVVLLMIRYKINKKRALQAENQLVRNAAELGTGSPATSVVNIYDDTVLWRSHDTSVTDGDVRELDHVTLENGDTSLQGRDCLSSQVTEEKPETLEIHLPSLNQANDVQDIISRNFYSSEGCKDTSAYENATENSIAAQPAGGRQTVDGRLSELLKAGNVKISSC